MTETVQHNNLYDFCYRYFKHVGATILPSVTSTINVELPRDVDKELTDRPFYWMWIDAMNEMPPNTVLHLVFEGSDVQPKDPENPKPEMITPGCYRMQRILQSAKTRGMFAAAYEQAQILSPFALFIAKISFISDLRQDFLESYAIDLRDFQIYGNVMDDLFQRDLRDERPTAAQVLPIAINMDQLFHIVNQCIELDVQARDHSWAKEARNRLNSELKRLDVYYDSVLATSNLDAEQIASYAAERELRKAEIIWRTEPKVEVRLTQMALIYLAQKPRDR